MNRMRKNKLFPRQVSDIGAFLFVVLMMPATYIYETAVVVPAIYSTGRVWIQTYFDDGVNLSVNWDDIRY